MQIQNILSIFQIDKNTFLFTHKKLPDRIAFLRPASFLPKIKTRRRPGTKTFYAMKHFRHAWMLWIFGGGILGSSLFAGCNNDDPVTPDAQPEIVFAKESLDVPAEGGPFQIEYTIENPVANATLSAKCNDSWITDRYQNRRGHLIQRNQKRNSGKERSNHRSFVRGYPAGAFFYSKTGGPSGGGIYDNDFGHHHKNIPNYSPSRRPGNVLSVEHHPLPGCRRFQDG